MSYKLYLKMASTGIGFRWLDILEKEFDTNFVDLDINLGELEAEDPEIVCNARHKMTALSSCFAQLTHKAQTIFQNSAKVEAELVNLRAELIDAKAKKECLEQELRTVLLELHAAQLANKLPANHQNGEKNLAGLPNSIIEPQEICRIRKKLQDELEKSPGHKAANSNLDDDEKISISHQLAQLRHENVQLQNENTALRNSILALHSEVYGARLAAKYLDKELAGRIQQLQLLGKEMRGDIRDKLWRQLESEILLQRHKTVVRACRRNNHNYSNGTCQKSDANSIVPTPDQGLSDTRLVTVKRSHGQGLGISITGGREHGVPILISELEPNGPAALSGQLYIGDAILSVNGIDLKQACHKEAVHVLQQQTGDCHLMVQYIAAEDSDTNSLSEDGYNFQYRFFDTEVCDSNDAISLHPLQHGTGAMANTPTAPRTPDINEQSRNNSDDNMSCPNSPPTQLSPLLLTPNTDNNVTQSLASPQIRQITPNTEVIQETFSGTQNSSNLNVVNIETVDNTSENITNTNNTDDNFNRNNNELSNVTDNSIKDDDIENSNIPPSIDTDTITKSTIIINRNVENNMLDSFSNCNNNDSTITPAQEKIIEHEQFFENNRTIIQIEESPPDIKNTVIDDSNLEFDTNLNISTNSLLYTTESDNASSPLQTSTDNFLSSDIISNHSDSPKSSVKSSNNNNNSSPVTTKTTAFVVKNFKTELYEPKVYRNNIVEFTEKKIDQPASIYPLDTFQSSILDSPPDIPSKNSTFKSSSFCDNDSTTSDYVTDTVLGIFENITAGVLSDKLDYSGAGKEMSDIEKTHLTNLLELQKFQEFCKNDEAKHYSSNSESFSNNSPKSGQSFNASCLNESYESSPVHHHQYTSDLLRKNTRKLKNRKSHGVKTLQSIFRSNDYLSSDISSANSDFNDEINDMGNKLPILTTRNFSPVTNPSTKVLKKSLKHMKNYPKTSSDEKSSPELEKPIPFSGYYEKSQRKIEQDEPKPFPKKVEYTPEFDQNIHAFLTETFSKGEIQLPNLKIINSVQRIREKPSPNNNSIQNRGDDTSSPNEKQWKTLTQNEKTHNKDLTTPKPNSTNKSNTQIGASQMATCTNYVEGFLNSINDQRLNHPLSPESEYSDDNATTTPAELVQYGRNLKIVNQDLISFHEDEKNTDPVYIDEKRLKENKEKLLERYVRANQNLLNLEGNGDPDFGTPV